LERSKEDTRISRALAGLEKESKAALVDLRERGYRSLIWYDFKPPFADALGAYGTGAYSDYYTRFMDEDMLALIPLAAEGLCDVYEMPIGNEIMFRMNGRGADACKVLQKQPVEE
jgi:hypothetical protein